MNLQVGFGFKVCGSGFRVKALGVQALPGSSILSEDHYEKVTKKRSYAISRVTSRMTCT